MIYSYMIFSDLLSLTEDQSSLLGRMIKTRQASKECNVSKHHQARNLLNEPTRVGNKALSFPAIRGKEDRVVRLPSTRSLTKEKEEYISLAISLDVSF